MENEFTIDKYIVNQITEDNHTPSKKEVQSIIENSHDRNLTYEETNILINAISSSEFEEIKKIVIENSKQIRQNIHNGRVVVMAPVEVTNRCSSNCDFCGWRSDNKKMQRLNISDELVLTQVEYLIDKGIHHIELVGGDDIKFVKDELPTLLNRAKKLFPNDINGVLSFCTMALTSKQYKDLKKAGADTMIMWQETYDRDTYYKYITTGPKAWGIKDNFKVEKNGDGFDFRLKSQDRAIKAGLNVSVGSMLGLNPDLNFEIISTISHANHLLEKYAINQSNPIIVGMPTWNKITTKETDKRPSSVLEVDNIFSYLSSLYFLSMDKQKTWIFPNCRVSMDTQVEAVAAGGVFTSTEVKLGPGGYLPKALELLSGERKIEIIDLFSKSIKTEHDSANINDFFFKMEQFMHHYHLHEEYIEKFENEGLTAEPI